MDSMINIGGYGIWEWGINLNVHRGKIKMKEKKTNTAALLYILSAIIWLLVAGFNFVNGQSVYGGLYIVLVVLCLILAKRKNDESKK